MLTDKEILDRTQLQKHFETAPEFAVYRYSNRGEYRVLRCEFPQLMGWSTLRRPEKLPRSLKAPYFSGPIAPLSMSKERMSRPHVNRLHVFKDTEDNHLALKKNNIILREGPPLYKSGWGELRVATWQGKNDQPIIVRMYNKNSDAWKKVEGKLLREICQVTQTGHPNFLQYFGAVESAYWKYHMFEYMPRGDLLSVLKKEKQDLAAGAKPTLTPSIIKTIFLQIVYAISHLHDKDLVHRNLKLENILVGNNWEVRIIDIAHVEKTTAQNRGNPGAISKTTFNHEYGPLMYRSPERLQDVGFNPLLDQVWGLGVILYALFYRKFPWPWTKIKLTKAEIERQVMGGTHFPLDNPVELPVGGKVLLHRIFRLEAHRPRTFEVLEDPWLKSDHETDIENMKRANAMGRFTHEEADRERYSGKRLMSLRKKMFKHFKLFREDYRRQPEFQGRELRDIKDTLENAERLLGPTPFGVHEVEENIKELHELERLYKEEYWPTLYAFNPLKCKYLGINRIYCKPRWFPVHVNLQRLMNTEQPTWGLPPPRGVHRQDDDDVDDDVDDEEDDVAIPIGNYKMK